MKNSPYCEWCGRLMTEGSTEISSDGVITIFHCGDKACGAKAIFIKPEKKIKSLQINYEK